MLYKAKSKIHGNGLFSSKSFKKDEFVGTFKLKPTKRESKFTVWITDYDRVDNFSDYLIRIEEAYNATNILKYANHSNKPNTEVFWNEETNQLEMWSLKRIPKDTEILWRYE